MTRLEGKEQTPPWLKHTIEAVTLLVAVAIALTIGLVIFGSAIIISKSMEPTFLIGDKVLLDKRAALHHNWRRGDVILFNVPENWKENDEDEDTLFKRVIGLPGETVSFSQYGVAIDGRLLNEDYLAAPTDTDPMSLALGDNEYFVMGDNRANSADSRVHGAINDNDIIGRVLLRIGPLSRFGKIPPPPYQQ